MCIVGILKALGYPSIVEGREVAWLATEGRKGTSFGHSHLDHHLRNALSTKGLTSGKFLALSSS